MDVIKPKYYVSRLPFASELDYDGQRQARRYLDMGVPPSLLYFWFNVTHGNYKDLPQRILDVDRADQQKRFPEHSKLIETWKYAI